MFLKKNNKKLSLIVVLLLVTACGGGGGSDSTPTPVTSAPPSPPVNNAPVVSSANTDMTAEINVEMDFDASKGGTTFSDSDGDSLSYSISISPANSDLRGDGPVLRGFATELGQFEINITATDGNGGSASDIFFIDFENTNQFAPSLENPNNDQITKMGLAFDYDTSQGNSTFFDFDGDTITYTVTLTPAIAGLTTDGASIRGVATELATSVVTVKANDGRGLEAEDVFTLSSVDNLPPQLQNPNFDQFGDENVPFEYDVSQGGTTFVDLEGDAITYSVSFEFPIEGLVVDGPIISGTPTSANFTVVTVTATDALGNSSQDEFFLDIFFDFSFQGVPNLPDTKFNYANPDLPAHFTDPNHPLGNVVALDNTPASNPVTDAGATLGRVLFYDPRLSSDDFISCAFCHEQSIGFSDFGQTSSGVGGSTDRHSMGLANANYYQSGKFFWDERSATLEEQVLEPIISPIELGSTLPDVVAKLIDTDFYPALFNDAFGSEEITSHEIALALAQFIRSMKSFESKFDEGVPINFSNFTEQEALGHRLFSSDAPGTTRTVNCNACHTTSAHIADTVHNTGLDIETSADEGAGNGQFKVPSLRNISVRAPYMHDGRFFSLEEVIDFYNSDVQPHVNLDENYKDTAGNVKALNLTDEEKAALIAYLNTLTDNEFLSDPKFSNPFF